MTALSRASFARAFARVCFLLVFQSTGLYLPELLSQRTAMPADALRKQASSVQAAALASAQRSLSAAAASQLAAGAAGVADPTAHADSDSAALTIAAPRKPGVHRIGLVLPQDQIGGEHDGESIRNAEAKLLTTPIVETVRLHGATPAQAVAEAHATGCDFILASTLSQQQADAPAKTGRFGKLLNLRTVQMAATAAQFVPAVQGAAMVTTMVTGQALSTQLLTASKSVKANADVRYEYTLTDADGTVKLHETELSHSTHDGEDVLTPLLTGAAGKLGPAMTQ